MNEKIRISNNAFIYPMPVVIVGADVDGKPNYMTAAWITRVNYNPPMLSVAVGRTHHTTPGIREHGEFGISIPGEALVAATDYVGIVSGAKADKSGVFETFRGGLAHAPMARECPLTMECRVTQTVELANDALFIADIVAAYSEDKYLTGGAPDVLKMKPFVLTMPDNHYWGIGAQLADAWSAGKEYKPS
ncbi:MAG: flavin reductase family protein [Candidatus Sumerlaeota bacterium]|nr:flavin reductase family protein [Candidatus Sumerlaeota bacterium]